MKKHLYLHIGTNKTGSTSIQHWMKENSKLLTDQGYYYPMEGAYFYRPEASQSLLAHALLDHRPEYIQRTVIDHDACVADIRRDIEMSKCRNVIVSSEHLSKAENIESVQKIYDVFSDLFDSITVIIYLRRQDHRLESIWSQRVKSSLLTTAFDEYCTEQMEVHGGDYFDLLSPWAKVFGKNKLVVRPFETRQFFKKNLIQDFMNLVGCDIGEIESPPRNVSPPIEFIEIVRLFGTSIPKYTERKNFLQLLISLSIKVDGTKYTMLSQEKRRFLLDHYRLSNQQVAKEYLGRPDGALFLENEISDLPVYPGLDLKRFSEISRRLILSLFKINRDLAAKIPNSG